MSEKRIILWCGDAPNQKALANKIAKRFNLCGIVIDEKKSFKKTPGWKKIQAAFLDRIFFKKILNAWTSIQQEYRQQYAQWPDLPQLAVDSINNDEAFNFTKQLAPDLIVVSGTALVKTKMLSLDPSIGIINLHTGLSPYIKGGPNCTNWCIATGQFDKIGNTIMWINEGIDAGNIISTELTRLPGVKDLKDIQWKVMEHAHDLYVRAIHYLLNVPPPHNSVPQKQIAPGKLYLTRMWNFSAKRKLLANLPKFLKNKNEAGASDIITVPIKENINVL